MLNILGIITSILRKITDSFNRSDGSLGSTDTGQAWSATRGTWTVSSNKATSSDSASSYPLATVSLGSQNAIVSADIVDGGPGVAFWITDANSWWASSVNYRSVQTGQSYYTASLEGGNQLTQGYWSGTNVTTPGYYANSEVQTGISNCPSGCTPSGNICVIDGGPSEGQFCAGGTPIYSCIGTGANCNYVPASTNCSGPGGNSSSGGGNCGIYTAPTYSPTTCTGAGGNSTSGGGNCGDLIAATYNYYTELKLYKNVSGTISTVATEVINTNSSSYVEANSIKASTSGDNITITAYQSAGLSSPFATTLTNTPSSPLKGTIVGIIKTPSTENAGSLLDNFSAE